MASDARLHAAPLSGILALMRGQARHMRGVVVIGVVRALRKWMRHTGQLQIPGLEAVDLELLLGETIKPDPWYAYDQYLRLMAASFRLLCRDDWATLREYCATGVAPVYGLGYQRLLHAGDPARTMSAVSVMWRSCHDFGSAFAETSPEGAILHVIGYPDVEELDGNVNLGWFLGMARCGGAEVTQAELLRCPWLDQGDEQVVRLRWRLAARDASESSGRWTMPSTPETGVDARSRPLRRHMPPPTPWRVPLHGPRDGPRVLA